MQPITVNASDAINALFEGTTELALAEPYKIDCGISRRIRVFVTQIVPDRLASWRDAYRAGNDELCAALLDLTERNTYTLMEKTADLREMSLLHKIMGEFRRGCNQTKGYNTH